MEVLLVEGEWVPWIQVILPFFMTMDVFIPNEILKVKDLNITEKVVLAIYKYYTEQGKYKCCSLSKPQIADELGISAMYMKKIKNHLKELGYIRTDGGIRVIYLGVQGDTIVPTDDVQGDTIVPTGGYQSTQGGIPEYPQGDTIVPTKGVPEYPHKKEKEKKEIKKEEKKITNFELILDRLPQDYKTPERIDYLQKNYKDRLNKTDLSGGILDMAIINIKNTLNKELPIEYIIPKTEPKIDYVDMF